MSSVQSVVSAAMALLMGYSAIKFALADCDLRLFSASDSRVAACFKNKRVWITGASSGIGRELATMVVKNGGHVLLSSRSESSLLEVKQELESFTNNPKAKVSILVVDLADLKSLPDKVRQAREIMDGDIDILVNNGGVSQRCFSLDSDFEADEHILKVDFLSATILSKTLLLGWQNQASQKGIINISSLAGKMGVPLRSAYCAAKFALLGFMDALRSEYGHEGFTICNICPGSVFTNVSKNALMGKKDRVFGSTDDNIAKGMKVNRCCQLILRAYSHRFEESWTFGNEREKFGIYLSQYFPSWFPMLSKAQRKQAHAMLSHSNNNNN